MSLSLSFEMQGTTYKMWGDSVVLPRRRPWGYEMLRTVAQYCRWAGAGATIKSQESGSSRIYTYTIAATDYPAEGDTFDVFPNVTNKTGFRALADRGLRSMTATITVTVDDGQENLLNALHLFMYWGMSVGGWGDEGSGSALIGVPTTGDMTAMIDTLHPQPFFPLGAG